MPDLFSFTGAGPLLVFLTIVILALLVFYVASRYHVANANEALIVAGSRGSKVRNEKGQMLVPAGDRGVKVVVGGGTFVLPLIHRVGRLKLTARQISVQLTDAVTSQGIKVHVQGVATFKIGRDVESLRNAAERFLDSKDEQVDSIVKNVLEGSLRSIVGTLTIEELIMDRQKLQQAVQDAAKGDLATSGLQIDAFTIQSISDESNYIELLGQQKLSVVTRDARMAKASADQQAAVREAEAEQIKINAQRDVSLKRADALVQTAAAEARANQAGPLAQAEAQQEVVRKQTELADLEAARKEKELLSTTVKPAAAEAQAAVQRAEGEKQARIRAAEAEAETTRLEGGAEAAIVLTKGEAEAKALAMRADAYKQFNDAAIIQTILASLPDIVRAAAEPMSHIDSLTVMSADGATDVVRSGTRAVIESATAIKGLTGLDVPGLIGNAMQRGSWRPNTPPDSSSAPPAAASTPSSPPAIGAGMAAAAGIRAASSEVKAAASDMQAAASEARAVASQAKDAASAVRAGMASVAEPITGTTAVERARVLARQLQNVPGVEQYLGMKLNDLETRTSRPVAALWRMSSSVLAPVYGEMTVGELINRFATGQPAA